MTEYDIFLPLRYPDGAPIESRKIQQLHRALFEQFEGLAFFPQSRQGSWTHEGVTFRDEIAIYRVMGTDTHRQRRFLRNLKEELKADLNQDEILIVERSTDEL